MGLAVGMEYAVGVAEVEERGEGEDSQVVASSRPVECAVPQTVPRNEGGTRRSRSGELTLADQRYVCFITGFVHHIRSVLSSIATQRSPTLFSALQATLLTRRCLRMHFPLSCLELLSRLSSLLNK